MNTWQVQDAKQRFSELVQRALDEGPQLVTRHGKATVVVLAAEEYALLAGSNSAKDFKSFLASAPDLSLLELEDIRRDLPRSVDLCRIYSIPISLRKSISRAAAPMTTVGS